MLPLYDIDMGPMNALLGQWEGHQGKDISPEDDGTEYNDYYETPHFTPIGRIKNAEEQLLSGVHYTQVVQRQTNDKVFHHQSGYWSWEKATNLLMHCFTLGRGIAIIATGEYRLENNRHIFEVSCAKDDAEPSIIESPFMKAKASTHSFWQKIEIQDHTLSYQQSSLLAIYGKSFEHKETNHLNRIQPS